MKFQLSRLVTLVSLLSLIAFAQSFGNFSGTVKDPKGAVIFGAQVTVRHETTGETKTATTDAISKFSVAKLPPGTYAGTAHLLGEGFKPNEQKSRLKISAIANVEINQKLLKCAAK
ncbi:MAG: carboxypeptidase-like regulatory domain-containing protein [Blastocatellia bacterium]